MKLKYLCLSLFLFAQFSLYCQKDTAVKTLWTADWSPNGKYIAVGGINNDLKIIETFDFKVIASFPVENSITRIKWHPRLNMFALVSQLESENAKGRLYYPGENRWVDLQGVDHGGRGIAWNKSGEYLAIGDNDGLVCLYTNKGEFIRKIKADPKIVAGISWQPGNNIFVTVGSEIGIYDIQGNVINKFKPDSVEIFMLSVDWHTSGDFFAVGDYGDPESADNKRIIFWTIDGKKINEITGSKGEYRNIAWSPDGNKIAGACDALRIWNKNGDLLASSSSSGDYLWGLDWSPDGRYLITSSNKGFIRLWDKKARLIKTIGE